MLEFAVLCAGWLAFLVFVSGKGTQHLVRPHAGVTLPLAGGLAAALAESLPTMPLSPGFTLRTVVAVLAGVFAGRLFVRLARYWALGHEQRAAAAPPRLVHPLIAAGLFAAGVPALWHLISSNHAFLEEELTPRDAKTGIVHGCEEIRAERGSKAAVLLVHGLYVSPAGFGRLPERLGAAGFDVYAPLLPGHGRRPDDLDAVWSADYRKAVRAEYDRIAASHARVAVVGHSMGATLALLAAAERQPAALVLASPYLGRLATPSWCPVEFDTIVGPLSRVVRRVLVSEDLRGRAYATRSLHALRQYRDLAKGLEPAAAAVACPALVLSGDADRIVPTRFADDWTRSHLPRAKIARFAASGHRLYVDDGAEAAVAATVEFLAAHAK